MGQKLLTAAKEMRFHAQRHRDLAARTLPGDKRRAHELLAVEYERLALLIEQETAAAPVGPAKPALTIVTGASGHQAKTLPE